MSQNNLFTPIKLGPYTLKNRAVIAPLTRNRANETYAPHALNTTNYKMRRATRTIRILKPSYKSIK